MMSKAVKIVPLEPKHAAIAPYLRLADIREHKAMSDLPIDAVLAFSIAHSERGFAVELHDRIAAIFGVNDGVVWLVGTDEIAKHPVMFYRLSKKIFQRLSDGYDKLFNFVDNRNTLSLRWLKWLGFKIEPAQKINNGFFHFAHWEREKEDPSTSPSQGRLEKQRKRKRV